MGIGEQFEQMKDRAQEMLGQPSETVEEGTDIARDVVDETTGGRYSDQLEQGVEQMRERFGDQSR